MEVAEAEAEGVASGAHGPRGRFGGKTGGAAAMRANGRTRF
jgi:hypothetical protein